MHVAHFKAIESVKSAQRGNKMGKKIDPGRSRPGKKIGQLEVYTPPVLPQTGRRRELDFSCYKNIVTVKMSRWDAARRVGRLSLLDPDF